MSVNHAIVQQFALLNLHLHLNWTDFLELTEAARTRLCDHVIAIRGSKHPEE